MERTLNTKKISLEDRSDAILFTKDPLESLFESLYRAALELGLEAEVDEKKYKITVKTVKAKEEESKELSEEEQILSIQDPQEVEMCFKFSKVEVEEEIIVAEAVKVKGTRLSMRKVFVDLRSKLTSMLV